MQFKTSALLLTLLIVPATCSASLNFTKNGQKALIPYQPKMDLTGEMTLEVWIKPSEKCKTHFFNYVISRNYGDIGFGICIQGHDHKTPNIGHTEIPFGRWTHLAIVDGRRAAKLYVNGELSEVLPGDARRKAGSLPMFIGNSNFDAEPGDQTTQFYGEIAEVSIWNVALDQDQVRKTMRHAPRRRQAHLVAYFPLAEGKGTLVHDMTGHWISGHLGDSYEPDTNDPGWSSDEPPIRRR